MIIWSRILSQNSHYNEKRFITKALDRARSVGNGYSKNISDFKSWISSGQYIIRSVPSKKEIQIEINNDYAFSHMLAYDSCRTATASFESMQSIHSINGLPKSYSWIAITCYYAAFSQPTQ